MDASFALSCFTSVALLLFTTLFASFRMFITRTPLPPQEPLQGREGRGTLRHHTSNNPLFIRTFASPVVPWLHQIFSSSYCSKALDCKWLLPKVIGLRTNFYFWIFKFCLGIGLFTLLAQIPTLTLACRVSRVSDWSSLSRRNRSGSKRYTWREAEKKLWWSRFVCCVS